MKTQLHNFGTIAIETRQRLIALQERNSKFILNNPQCRAVLKIHVDPDVQIPGKKCDWLLIEISSWLSIFIELKGRNINHALEQLSNTIKHIGNPSNGYIVRSFNEILAFIVATQIPLANTETQRAMKLFREKYNATLTFKSKICERTIYYKDVKASSKKPHTKPYL